MSEVVQRHGRRCKGGRCSCPWQAAVYSKADGKKIRKAFQTRAAAVAWRDDSRSAVRTGAMRAPLPETLREAWLLWLESAETGLIRNRSGDRYKPSAVRSYEAAMRLHVLPVLGSKRFSEITRVDLQDLADSLLADRLSPSTISVALMPVRSMFRRALQRGEVAINPTSGLALPAVRSGRDRIAPPEECQRLLAALPAEDRALWATAMYAGLRRGELMALRVADIDLGAGVIHVRRGWDPVAGEIATKTGKDRRVPIATVLRDYLDEHLLTLPWSSGLVFGHTSADPFRVTSLKTRSQKAWKASKLNGITLHECRHTFASLMIAAGVNAKALSTYMGHFSISITLDRYGHLMPGNETDAARLLDDYLTRSDTASRVQQFDTPGTNPGTSPQKMAI